MPNGKVKKSAFYNRRSRASVDSDVLHARFTSDVVEGSVLPNEFRRRLRDLFSQIEKEFEILYSENYQLKDQIVELQERFDSQLDGKDTPDTTTDKPSGSGAIRKSAGSQVAQKIKTTYKTSTSKLVSTFKTPTIGSHLVSQYIGHKDGIWEVNVSKGATKVLGTASADHSARLWNIDTGATVVNYEGHRGSVNSIRFHPTDDLVLTGSGDHTSHIWRSQVPIEKIQSSSDDDNIETELLDDSFEVTTDPIVLYDPSMELKGHRGVVIAADWLAGGHQVITASWDRTAILFDAQTGEIIQTLKGHDLELTDVHSHPTQQILVTSSKDTSFRLWDLREQSYILNVFQGHTQPVTSAVFAGDHKVVSGSDDRCIKIWDLKNMHSPLSTIRTDSGINRLSISGNQSIIAVPHDNRHIRLYDISGVRIGRLPRSNRQGHSRIVCSIAWHDDVSSHNLFSCGFDGKALGWRISQLTKDSKSSTSKEAKPS